MGENENPTGADAPLGSGLTSGTASEALLRAAEAASSADTQPEGKTTGDTMPQVGDGTPESKPAATGQPATSNPAGSQPAPDGTPEHRIQAAVRNAREQATREVEARYAAFKGMDPEQVSTGLALLREIQADPGKFLEELSTRLGRPATAPAAAVADDEDLPEPDLVSKDGQLRTYKAETLQKMLDIHGRRIAAAIRNEVKPFIDYTQTAQTREQQAADYAKREQVVRQALEEARELPHFTKENEPAILEILQGMSDEARASLGPVAALHKAYALFLKERVFPTIDSDADRRVRESFTRKAATSAGTVHPSGQGGDTKPPELKGVADLAAHMERMAAGQAG